MRFIDILPSFAVDEIMVRTNYPEGLKDELSDAELKDGMLFGYCAWDGEHIKSLDGDTYPESLEIERYEVSDHGFVVWFHSDYV